MTKKQKQEPQTVGEPTTTQSSPTVDTSNVITLQDLQNILVVFDLASNRGAFKGSELEPIGQLYNKIAKFVRAAQPAAPVEDSTTTTTSDTVNS